MRFSQTMIVGALLMYGAILTAAPQLSIKSDKKEAVFNCGEPAGFSANIKDGGKQLKKGTVSFFLTLDGGKQLERLGPFDLAETEQPIQFERTLEQPGFLRVSMMHVDEGKQSYGVSVVGFEPEKITMGAPRPDDFKSFWDEQKKDFREKAGKVTFTPVPEAEKPGVKVFRVAVSAPSGRIIHGFLSIPNKSGEAKYPMLVMVPGAGPGFGPDTTQTGNGIAILILNVQPYENSLDNATRQKQHAEFIAAGPYQNQNIEDRERYFFKEFFLGVDCAIDAAAELPGIDAARIGIYGSSQGGGSAVILAAMNQKIKGAVVNVPALCDHSGYLQERESGWPKFYNNKDIEDKETALENARYFDAGNFALDVKCPTHVIVGFLDMTCRPGTVYAMYNNLAGEKKMTNEPLMQHEVYPSFYREKTWLITLLRNIQ